MFLLLFVVFGAVVVSTGSDSQFIYEEREFEKEIVGPIIASPDKMTETNAISSLYWYLQTS